MRYLPPRFAIFVTLLALIGTSGCAGKAGGITLTSTRTHQSYNQGFYDAYAGRNEHGDLDILLIDTAAARILAGDASPRTVHQIMHLRVLWQPERDAKSTDIATSNGSVHWYVISPGGTMEYRGTAFIGVATFSGYLRVTVQNAQMKPVVTVAGMRDPVGPSMMSGAVLAQMNHRVVKELLSQIHNSLADAAPAQ